MRARARSAGHSCRPRRWTYGQATALKSTSALSTTSSVGRERAVGGAVAEERDERAQVVGRLPGAGAWWNASSVASRSGRWRSRSVAERLEPPHEPLPAGAAGGEHGVHRVAEVLGEPADERADERLSGQPLAPERRSRAPRHLRDPLERQPVPAPLAEDGDRRGLQFWLDLS